MDDPWRQSITSLNYFYTDTHTHTHTHIHIYIYIPLEDCFGEPKVVWSKSIGFITIYIYIYIYWEKSQASLTIDILKKQHIVRYIYI